MQAAPESLSDEAIVEHVLAGDVNAFAGLIGRHRGRVFAIVFNHVPPAHAEEVAHESFVRAYRSLGTYRRASPFGHWLARIAVRTCCDFWRERKRRREVPASELSDRHLEWIEAVSRDAARNAFDRQAERTEAAEILDWALERLTPEDRVVLTLVHREGRSVREAADLLGWSSARVKVQAYRARFVLRGIIRRTMDKMEEKS